jgi:hypothetical protein
MNIFALSRNPVEAARQMLDKHIVKMPTETCQMLHTNHLFFAFVDLYGYEPSLKELKQYHKDFNSNLMKPAMLNHPSTIWARKSMHNAKWLYEHGLELCKEYTYRYGKEHGSESRINDMNNFYMESASWEKATPVDIAMFDKYRIPNDMEVHNWDYVIKSYRHYYLEGKWRFASWRKNRRPEWYPENWYAVQFNKEVRSFNERNNGNLKLMEE